MRSRGVVGLDVQLVAFGGGEGRGVGGCTERFAQEDRCSRVQQMIIGGVRELRLFGVRHGGMAQIEGESGLESWSIEVSESCCC